MMTDVIIRLLMALEAVVCLLLIGIILIQRSKGQGVGLSFGGGAAESVFGGQMGNVLTRTTVILAFVFLVNTTVLAVLKPKGVSASVVDRIVAPVAAAPAEVSESAPSEAELAEALADVAAPEAAATEAATTEAAAAEAAAPAEEAPAPEAPAAPEVAPAEDITAAAPAAESAAE